MDFGKAFTYMFEDPDWLRKLAIGTAVMLVGLLLVVFLIGIIPLMIATGYTVDVVRNVRERRPRPLPEWNDWGGFLSRGFKVWVAFLVWALPMIVLTIPLAISAAILDNNGRGMEAIGIPLMVCGYCLMFLWGIFLALVTPAIYLRIAETDRIGSAFEVGRIWAFTRDNLGNIIVVLLLSIVVGLIAAVVGTAGFIVLFVGLLITIPLASLWEMLVMAHLYGQVGAVGAGPAEIVPFGSAPIAPIEAAPAEVVPAHVPPAEIPPAERPADIPPADVPPADVPPANES